MSSNRKLIAVMLSTVMLLSVVGPGLAAAEDGAEAYANLSIDVEQNGGVDVTVTDDGDAVENATLNVSVSDDDATYDDEGSYLTDENGTVSLTAPDEDVNVTFEAENSSAEKTVLLLADDDESDTDVFGQQVMKYVHGLLSGDKPLDDNMTFGQQVANWVIDNNPGNAPDHAGPSGEQGPPEHAGNNSDDAGPPGHAGPPGENTVEDDEVEDAETEEDDEDAETEEDDEESEDS